MRPAHSPQYPEAGIRPRSIKYEDWRPCIQTATELDELVVMVKAYLSEWRPDELELLPLEAAIPTLSSSEEIPVRAVVATQAELKADPSQPQSAILREMSLTMMAAATRLRFLKALRVRHSGR